jgi:hypothetical protein
MAAKVSISHVLKMIPDDELVTVPCEMFCSEALLGSDTQNLVKLDLLQVCFASACNHLNENVSLESDRDKKRKPGGSHGKQKAVSFEVRQKLHGESLMEVLNPPNIALICINIMRSILQIM